MRILVDTSVWIEWLNGRKKPNKEFLESVVVCGPVVQEVLQGLKNSHSAKLFKESFLYFPVVSDPIPLSLFQKAAELYRLGRDRGITIRSSTDCLIASIAIDLDIPILHKDRDYSNLSKFTSLESHKFV